MVELEKKKNQRNNNKNPSSVEGTKMAKESNIGDKTKTDAIRKPLIELRATEEQENDNSSTIRKPLVQLTENTHQLKIENKIAKDKRRKAHPLKSQIDPTNRKSTGFMKGMSKTLMKMDNLKISDNETIKDPNDNIGVNNSKIVCGELKNKDGFSWEDIKISSSLKKRILEEGILFPSPVQYEAIPPALLGRDVIVKAKNGTGKTLSFVIPTLQRINLNNSKLQVIILVPIRELALQIAKIIKSISGETIKCVPMIGGVDILDDIIRISTGVHILIGTPGRIVDGIGRGLVQMDTNPMIIFDEADKLLDDHFFGDVYKLMEELLPAKKQLCLYSATYPSAKKFFITQYLVNPLQIQVHSDYALRNVTHFFVKVEENTKLPCLKSLLASLDINQCIIYCNSIKICEMLAKKITEIGLSSYFIHSSLSQEDRNIIYHNFSKSKCKFLVSTDITTRGIDVHGVNIVINFELPTSSESYLHRIGRAGRFGTKACCISLIDSSERPVIEQYAKFVGSDISPACGYNIKDFCSKI